MNVLIVAFYATIITVNIHRRIHMKRQQSSQVVLLSRGQVEALQRIQEEERKRSEYGIAPSIHEVARRIFDRALPGEKK